MTVITNQKIHNRTIVPADGIKGKTWGPSTLHQRERGHLPAMRQTSARKPQFSKSAPNLDKSRTAMQLQNDRQDQTDLTRNNILGKSVEGLNTINNSSSTDRHVFDDLDEEEDDSHYDIDNKDYDDDDDDDVNVKGCFGFIRGVEESYVKRKKFSLDSKMTEHHARLTNDVRSPIILASTSMTRTMKNFSHDDDENIETCERKKKDDVIYDQAFYRTIQKSLDNIFSRDDFNQQFIAQKARNSKSSGDLTMYNEEEEIYGEYRFQTFGSGNGSKFNRECFFANHDDSMNGEEESDRDVSNKTQDQENQNSQKSTDSPLSESFASINLSRNGTGNRKHIRNRSFDECTNSMCSDKSSSIDLSITQTVSRKSSVTFRVDNSSTSGHDQLFYDNIDQHLSDELPSDVTARFLPGAKKQYQNYSLIGQGQSQLRSNDQRNSQKSIKDDDLKSALSKKDRKDKPIKSKYKSLTRFLKFRRNSTSRLHSNSIYNKLENRIDMDEQLLVDDKANTNLANEPQYDAIFRTKNFVLAKQNES